MGFISMGLASFYVGSPSLSQPLDMKPFMRTFQEVTHPSTTLVGFISMGLASFYVGSPSLSQPSSFIRAWDRLCLEDIGGVEQMPLHDGIIPRGDNGGSRRNVT